MSMGVEEMQDDPISISILWARLIAIADDASTTLIRSSFSTVARESNDLAVVITDEKGQTIAQSSISVPSFLGTIPLTIRAMIDKWGLDGWDYGDVAITNDPWLGTGHLPDVTVVSPIFKGGRVVGFIGSTVHMVDIGGPLFGSSARDVYEEGLYIPLLKLYRKGEENEVIFEMLRVNVRSSEQVIGDVRAMLSANEMGTRALLELMEEQQMDDLSTISRTVLERAEQAMRHELRKAPEGRYACTAFLDGYDEQVITIHCTVTIQDGGITVDYDGSSPQQPVSINAVQNYAFAYSAFPIKAVFNPDIPNNEGFYRPIQVVAPEHTVMNAQHPAPVQSRHVIGSMLQAPILGALAQAVPDKVQADSGTPPLTMVFVGRREDGAEFFVFDFINGGLGARATSDGISCISFPSNVASVPIEIMENLVPIQYLEQRLIPNSGGNGKYRGGLGQRKSFVVTSAQPIGVSIIMERTLSAPKGVLEGEEGSPAKAWLESGRPLVLKGLNSLYPGDKLVIESAGGGGYGDQRERDPEAVARDILHGYTTLTDQDHPSVQ